HPAPREGERQVRAHALEQQQVVGRHRLIGRFVARDRLREQYVARAIAQLLHDALVELLDRGELGLRHVGDLLDGREALLREDRGDVLVDVELLHEVLHEFLRLGLALGLGVGFGHDVEIQPLSWLARRMFWPPRPIACDSLSSATAMSMLCASSSTTIDMTSAGDMALITNWAGLST